MDDNRLHSVEILIQQQKYAAAKDILSTLLKEDPNNIYVLSLLAEVYLQQDNYEAANQLIDNAISMAPYASHLFHIKARIAIQLEQLDEAEQYTSQAIELDPYDADYFALLANIKLVRKQFEVALENANNALEIDAENLLALNIRSTALNKLNRSDESFETIEGALREDPNNAYTHANYGWGLLEKGDHKKALFHFKEALANNPSFEYAQHGILEAMKAKNPLYRLFLKYTFWMGNLTAKYQWAVLLGFYFGFRGLKVLARNNEALRPFLIPLLVVLALVAFSTWIMTPLSNLFLRFNKYGQLLLDKKQKISSSFVALSLSVFIVAGIMYALLSDERMLALAAFGLAMMLPFGVMLSPSKNKYGLFRRN